jgi:hypothetical protein
MVKAILDELNLDNSTNYKRDILGKYKDNQLFKRVCQMAYDKVKFTYGISLKNISEDYWLGEGGDLPLENALDILEQKFCTREWTGNKAHEELHNLLSSVSLEDAYVLERVIERDLKINIGRTELNKVWKNLITKPAYMRCGVLSNKTLKKIDFSEGAILQLKADGTYRSVTVDEGKVTIESRSGELSSFPLLETELTKLKDGVYVGELLVHGIHNRAEANGIINSPSADHSDVYIQLWDYITLDEFYTRPKDKKNKTLYVDRWNNLLDILSGSDVDSKKVTSIPTEFVSNIRKAMEQTAEWMKEGYEGSILKDKNNIFCDHTSPTQLKIKLEIELEVRITGFSEGKKGTKREKTFGAMMFETDDGKIKGQTSGFSDDMLKDFNSRREELIGQIFTIRCNDITISKDHDFYALSHPRFIELREDRDTTDTLERSFELKELAMTLGEVA